MLEKNVNGQATSYKYNVGNQLTEEIANGQTIGYIYNANGDLTEKTTGENYTYDIQGNLTAIVGNGLDKQYTYNGNGNRLSETTDGETIFYVNDINRRYEEVLQTYGEDGKVINSYTYGVQRINSVGQDNETYLYDGRGSVVGSVSDGVITSYAYTAYGSLMPDSPEPKVFGYNGEATDFGSGIQYLRARYYDSTINRFFQEDDYKGNYSNPISMNRYIYCEGNPVMGTDPSGYRPIDHGPVVVKPKFTDAYYAKMKQIEAFSDGGTGNSGSPGSDGSGSIFDYPPGQYGNTPSDENELVFCNSNSSESEFLMEEDESISNEFTNMYMQMQYDKSQIGWTEKTYEIIRDFFDSDTGTSSSAISSDSGYFFAEGTETTGFSEWNLRLNATQKFNDDEGKALFGLFTKAGVQQLKGYAGVDFYGQSGDGDITAGAYGILDLLVAKGKAAVAFDEDSFGVILEAKGAVASSRETIKFDIFDWEIEGGIYVDALSVGAKYQFGIFDGEYISEGNLGAGWLGGGYVFRVKPPEDWYK